MTKRRCGASVTTTVSSSSTSTMTAAILFFVWILPCGVFSFVPTVPPRHKQPQQHQGLVRPIRTTRQITTTTTTTTQRSAWFRRRKAEEARNGESDSANKNNNKLEGSSLVDDEATLNGKPSPLQLLIPQLDLVNGRHKSPKSPYAWSEEREWDHYVIVDGDPTFLFSEEHMERRQGVDRDTVIETLIPILTPVGAYLTYDMVAKLFDRVIDAVSMGTKKWVAVDGGAYQAKIITPAINGLVVPAIAVLFATLTSTTISTLRQRQGDIRRSLNMEAGELRAMEYIVAAFQDKTLQNQCRQYLIQYTSRLIAESQPRWSGKNNNIPSAQRLMDSELNGMLRCLTTADGRVHTSLIDEAYAGLARLRDARIQRLTALQSTYPLLHFLILGILAFGECTGFLIETNQDILVFLNAVQIKILWSMLVGTFAACFLVFYDLLHPFSGPYSVCASVDQLYTIRLGLKAEIELSILDIPEEETTISSSSAFSKEVDT